MIKLRDYQQRAVDAALGAKKGIVVAPCGSGKTIMMASIIKELNPLKTLWLAHTTEQVEQGKEAAEALGVNAGITFSCYAANPDASDYDLILTDECHYAGTEQVRAILRTALAGTDFGCEVYGFTATPEREDGYDITRVLGPILYEVTREEVKDAGGVLPADVRFVEVNHSDDDERKYVELAKKKYSPQMQWADRKNGNDKQKRRAVYSAALEVFVRKNKFRYETVAMLAGLYSFKQGGASTIVLLDTKMECEAVADLINAYEGEPVASALTSSSKGRSQIVDDFKDGELKFICCTSLADEGLDCPIAGLLVLACTGKAAGKVIQRTGRVLRPHEGKDSGLVIDVCDKHGMFYSQRAKRMSIYRDLGYRILD